jgi:Cu(I)/Ag(I) efflux system membrane fusion protein
MLSACNEKSEPEMKPDAPRTEQEAAPIRAPAFAAPEGFNAALGKAFDGYALIQKALAQDDLAGAKEAFSSMHAVLHMMPKEGLDSSALAYWNSTDARMIEALHPMASAETLDSVRTHFADFSETMADAIEKFGLAEKEGVFRFHCPMAANNKGADWLQKDKNLANPYFGKSMSTCGNLVGKVL